MKPHKQVDPLPLPTLKPNLTNHWPWSRTSPTACRRWEKCRGWKEATIM